MTYNDAVLHAWLTQNEIAEFFGVSIQTVRRWAKSNKAPTGVIQSLKLIAGDCPAFSAKSGWKGWAFSGGFLWSPEMDKFTAGDIRASKMDRDIIRGYERENAELREKIKSREQKIVKTAQIIPFPKRPNYVNLNV